MILEEKTLLIPKISGNKNLLSYFDEKVVEFCKSINVTPIRFVVTETTEKGYQCELGVLSSIDSYTNG